MKRRLTIFAQVAVSSVALSALANAADPLPRLQPLLSSQRAEVRLGALLSLTAAGSVPAAEAALAVYSQRLEALPLREAEGAALVPLLALLPNERLESLLRPGVSPLDDCLTAALALRDSERLIALVTPALTGTDAESSALATRRIGIALQILPRPDRDQDWQRLSKLRLSGGNGKERAVALLWLPPDQIDEAVAEVVLNDQEPEVRVALVECLSGQLSYPNRPWVFTRFMQLARDPEPVVATAAIKILAQSRLNSNVRIAELRPLMLTIINQPDHPAAYDVAQWYLDRPDPAAIPGLTVLVLQRDNAAALDALRAQRVPDLADICVAVLAGKGQQIRMLALKCLQDLGDPRVGELATGLVGDSEWYVREAAQKVLSSTAASDPVAFELAAIGNDPASRKQLFTRFTGLNGMALNSELETWWKSANSEQRTAMFAAVCRLGSAREHVLPFFASRIADSDPEIARAALSACLDSHRDQRSTLSHIGIVEALQRISDRDPQIAKLARQLATRLDYPAVIAAVTKAGPVRAPGEFSPTGQASNSSAYAQSHKLFAVDPALAADAPWTTAGLPETFAMLRKDVSIPPGAPRDPEAIERFLARLNDAEPWQQIQCCAVLLRMDDERVLALLRTWATGADPGLRLAAWPTLALLGDRSEPALDYLIARLLTNHSHHTWTENELPPPSSEMLTRLATFRTIAPQATIDALTMVLQARLAREQEKP